MANVAIVSTAIRNTAWRWLDADGRVVINGWSSHQGIATCKPVDNVHIGSYNRRLREKCLRWVESSVWGVRMIGNEWSWC